MTLHRTEVCYLCGELTQDHIFAGRMNPCGKLIVFGQCCESDIFEIFDDIEDALYSCAALHAIYCRATRRRAMREIREDLYAGAILVVDATRAGSVYAKNPAAN